MNLNDLFTGGSGEEVKEERQKTPWLKYDRKTQFALFRFLEEWDELVADARVDHWVEGVGRVRCNHLPIPDKQTGGVFLWDGRGKDKETGKRINKKPEHNCRFCDEQRAAVDEALQDLDPETPAGKEAAMAAKKLHQRQTQLISNVEYKIMEKKQGAKKPTVVQDVQQALLGIRINDLFSKNGKGEFKSLKSRFEMKGSNMDVWFVMGADGKPQADVPVTDAELATDEDREMLEKPKVMSYADGLAKYEGRASEASKAEPLSDEDEIVF